VKDRVTTFRKLVMPKDLNPANRLFGGQMMSWIDEAAALYVMCFAKTKNLVTLKVSEVIFKEPVEQGDFLIFEASTKEIGTTSISVSIEVYKKDIQDKDSKKLVCFCGMVFVTIDPETGKKTPHGIKQKKSFEDELVEYFKKMEEVNGTSMAYTLTSEYFGTTEKEVYEVLSEKKYEFEF